MRTIAEAILELDGTGSGSGSGGGAGGGVMYVTITGNDDDGYTADKTFSEVEAAYNNGSYIVAKVVPYEWDYVMFYNLDTYGGAQTDGIDRFTFVGIYANENGVVTTNYELMANNSVNEIITMYPSQGEG